MRLPRQVESQLRYYGVTIERYGRNKRGRPSIADQKWFFCGWYWSVQAGKIYKEGPVGPFPCWSAAAASAADRFGFGRYSNSRR